MALLWKGQRRPITQTCLILSVRNCSVSPPGSLILSDKRFLSYLPAIPSRMCTVDGVNYFNKLRQQSASGKRPFTTASTLKPGRQDRRCPCYSEMTMKWSAGTETAMVATKTTNAYETQVHNAGILYAWLTRRLISWPITRVTQLSQSSETVSFIIPEYTELTTTDLVISVEMQQRRSLGYLE